ncbi:hypothetical protein GF339_08270 [candidate division KSB3 bacterium]|uniref:Uncharacterized protein n=1 Tax=candidate division KSB3 bacterium TaxID=2044937 RepID=A0A9D5JVP8_9BACT|nr:hypothetical protein [candidate division KSB3 bacterium]MBD3324566.1 hypothetical protein [candidate division KSB3 bacterium]
MMNRRRIGVAIFATILLLPQISMAQFDFPFHGFLEYGVGSRIVSNEEKTDDMLLNEARLQLEFSRDADIAFFNFKTDFIYDEFLEESDVDIREANITLFPYDLWELKIGRQILTWGTGDLVFANDLFPKDWKSFFIGRDDEYLKAPVTAAKLSFYMDIGTLDAVVTPKFTPDTYIDGERMSYWGMTGITGEPFVDDKPDQTFEDAEYHFRFAKNMGGLELALYGYKGFFKRPLGFDPEQGVGIFPELAVYGVSGRTTFLGGIVNLETAYYDSLDDKDGDDPFIENSILKTIIGFEKEIVKNLTGSVQYFSEWMQDYEDYEASVRAIEQPVLKEENHDWITLRLTNLRKQQTLILSFFGYYSPAENDWHLRPKATYKMSDQIQLAAGANFFFGENDYTFFGQLEDNSNLYFRIRYLY